MKPPCHLSRSDILGISLKYQIFSCNYELNDEVNTIYKLEIGTSGKYHVTRRQHYAQGSNFLVGRVHVPPVHPGCVADHSYWSGWELAGEFLIGCFMLAPGVAAVNKSLPQFRLIEQNKDTTLEHLCAKYLCLKLSQCLFCWAAARQCVDQF